MAEWTLLNPPASRSKYNKRPGIIDPSTITTADITLTEAQREVLSKQPPAYFLLSRASIIDTALTTLTSQDPIYTIRDTGRGRFSSSPDFEIFRPNPSGLFVGSIRFSRSGAVTVKLGPSGHTVENIDNFSSALPSAKENSQKWMTVSIGRNRSKDSNSNIDGHGAGLNWIAELDCLSSQGEKSFAVKLVDSLPNGRFEIWDADACVDIGGDQALLDEMIVIAYAHMEKARRKLLKGPDPTGVGVSGIGMI